MRQSIFLTVLSISLLLLLLVSCAKEQQKQANDSQTASQTVTQPSGPVCGDAVCKDETQDTCPQDCGHADTCADTENAKDKNIKGTVSGFSNNTSYSFQDACLDDKTLQEFSCSGASSSSENISCQENEAVRDYCNATALFRDTMTSGCQDGACTKTKKRQILKICEVTCEDGKCVGGEQQQAEQTEAVITSDLDSCQDTDGGVNTAVKGTVSGTFNNSAYHYSDFCEQNTLVEYYCNGKAQTQRETACPQDINSEPFCRGSNVYTNFVDYSCVQGACMNITTPKLASFCTNGCENGRCK